MIQVANFRPKPFKMVAKLICIFVAVLVSCGESGGFKYPKVRRNESVIDDYFGTKVKILETFSA